MFEPEMIPLLFDKELRGEMWRRLEEWCDANGYEKGFYCPYIPKKVQG